MKEYQVNKQILAENVRLIDFEGNQEGVMTRLQALNRAEEEGLDLIAVDTKSQPVVCRLYDYGKFKFEQEKKRKNSEKKQRQNRMDVKEIHLRPVTEEHDKNVKINQANKFLDKNDKVKFVVKFKGRESTHKERGQNILNEIIEKTNGEIETHPTDNGKSLYAVMVPTKK